MYQKFKTKSTTGSALNFKSFGNKQMLFLLDFDIFQVEKTLDHST